MRTLLLALCTSAFVLLPGCSLFRSTDGPGPGECPCTMEFRMITVRVVDEAGRPVEGLAVTVRNERTGATLEVRQEDAGAFGAGVYAVATDAHVEDVSEAGDRLAFRASGGGRTAEATVVVARDACACHIEKESGPEEVVAR
jgi:uncharacterized protein YceK